MRGAGERPAPLRTRPAAVRLFGWLVLTSVMLNSLAILLSLRRFQADAIAQGTSRAGWFVAIVIMVVIYGVFWWRIAILAGNIARWLYIASVIMSLRQVPHIYTVSLDYGAPYGLLMAASFALALAGAAILIRRDVSRWLRSGGRDGSIDTSVFE